jgi:Inhibitor of Apoptosis domain
MEYSDYPHLKLLVRLNSFHEKWANYYLDPYFMALANFSLLFPETTNQKAVSICLSCNLCVVNVFCGADIFTIHAALRPMCRFLSQVGAAMLIPGPLRLELLRNHLYR